jgi:uncharacterized Zn finger protein
LTIHDFTSHLPAALLQRGRKYIASVGDVVCTEANGNNQWRATVQGSALYSVTIQVAKNDGEIVFDSCSCPFEGDFCKHKIAVLLHVTGEDAPPKRRNKIGDKADAILDQLSADDLRKFLRRLFDRDRHLARHFISLYASMAASSPADFKELIDGALSSLRTRHGLYPITIFKTPWSR